MFELVRDRFHVNLIWIGKTIVKPRQIVAACLLGLASLSGCDQGKEDATTERLKSMAGGTLKEVVVAKGVVSVDGQPAAGVNVFAHPQGVPNGAVVECLSDQNGNFCWSTNTACDGLEPGSYLLSFTYIPKPKKNGTGVDELKGKYRDPNKNKMELVVKAGAPQENLNYQLMTK